MKVLVTKANSDYWYKIRVLNTLEDISHFITECKHSIVIEKNSYIDKSIFDFWDGMKKEDIPVIMDCELHITIYNDYIE